MGRLRFPGIYRGWYVVAALFFGGFAVYGGGLYAFILFVVPLSNEFHWSRAATGGLVSAFFLSAPLSLFSASLIRRFGARNLAAIGILIEAAALVMLMATSELWQMYLLRALAGFGKVLYAMTLPVIVARWFSRRFGFALAIMYAGWHIGGLVLAPLTGHLITSIGWRLTSLVLGIGLLVVALLPTLAALRCESASDAGLALDGDGPASPVDAANEAGETGAVPWRTVVRAAAFRIFAVAAAIYWMIYAGVLAHQAAAVEAAGASPTTASFVLGATAGCGAIGALLIGAVMDRWSLLRATLVQYSLFGLGVMSLAIAASDHVGPPLLVHALCFGLAVGGSDVYWISALRRKVGDAAFPTSWGLYYFTELVTLVVGPAAAGALYDRSGSYAVVLGTEIVILAIPTLLSVLLAVRRYAPAR